LGLKRYIPHSSWEEKVLLEKWKEASRPHNLEGRWRADTTEELSERNYPYGSAVSGRKQTKRETFTGKKGAKRRGNLDRRKKQGRKYSKKQRPFVCSKKMPYLFTMDLTGILRVSSYHKIMNGETTRS